MKFENTQVMNFEGAIRGMRNPKNSWDKSDSHHNGNGILKGHFVIGEKDLELMQTLIKAGSEHRKFMRQIFVSVDITAPLYWWKEFDTYKVGTVSNSCSTMHKLASTPITMDCFEMDDFADVNVATVIMNKRLSLNTSTFYELILIPYLERIRQKNNELVENAKYLSEIKEFDEAKKARDLAVNYWKELIRILPESWLQKRTITMNYENLLAMCSKGQRRFHKLTEWSNSFIGWARTLPYAQELLFLDEFVK